MRKLVVVGLAGVFVLAVVGGQSAGAGPVAIGVPVLRLASGLPATHGGGSRAPRGWMPLHAKEFALAKAAANKRAHLGGGGSGAAGVAGGPAVTGYANVSPSFDGSFGTGLTPPDTTGAIGPDRYIEILNSGFSIYNRSGSLVSSDTLDALTGISTGLFGYALTDPQMLWDAKTQRFYYSVVYYDSLLFSDNGIAVGWSKTATPSSASDFCQYALDFGSELPDYDKLGDSSDFLLYGYNGFSNYASTYDGSGFAVLNKPPAGSSCPPTTALNVTDSGFLHNADGSLASTPVPTNLVDDSNGTGYVVANADLSTVSSANFVSVYSVSTNGVDANGIPIPQISGPTNVTVPSYSMPSSAPQSGSPYLLDTLDGRFEAAVAAVDPGHANKIAIWTAHSVFGGPGAEERWYEIDPNAGSLLQSGTVGSPSLFVWNGAVSPDRANNGTSGAFGDSMAMSVSTSSAASYPAIQFIWKHGTDPQSPLNNLVQSSGANVDFSCSTTTACRWGDYSGASPDPAAAGGVGTVWLVNQYGLAGGTTSSTSWRTWLFAVTPTSGAASTGLSFATAPQTLTAGVASNPIQIGISQAQLSDTQVTLASSSTGGQFATSSSGPWQTTLPVTIAAGATTSPSIDYRDTIAGAPTLTASATGIASATQSETVKAAAATTITVAPSSANLNAGGKQLFTATGKDTWGNPADLSNATWTTTAPGTLSPASGTSSTFTAGTTTGNGLVTATAGAASGSATVTVTATPPNAPTNLRASATSRRRIALSWTGSGTGVTYNVYRGTQPGNEAATPIKKGLTGTSYSDTTVTSGTTYYYRVTAVGPGGESAPSNEASAKAK